jgi:PhnB protein
MENKVMHARLRIGDTTLLASDGRCEGKLSFQGFSLSLTAPNEAEAERLFTSVGDGGQVQMPFPKTFFSPRFGMVTDRFGVAWMSIFKPVGGILVCNNLFEGHVQLITAVSTLSELDRQKSNP